RAAVKDLVLTLRRIELAVAGGRSEEAVAEYASFARLATFDVPQALKRAEPGTLFNPSVHDAYYRALGAMLQSADKSRPRSRRVGGASREPGLYYFWRQRRADVPCFSRHFGPGPRM